MSMLPCVRRVCSEGRHQGTLRMGVSRFQHRKIGDGRTRRWQRATSRAVLRTVASPVRPALQQWQACSQGFRAQPCHSCTA